MKKLIIILFITILLINPGEAKQVTKDEGQLKLIYEDRFNKGHDLQLRLQVNINISSIEIIIDRDDATITIFTGGPFTTWSIGDWIDTEISSKYLPTADRYQVRIVAYPQNGTVYTMFFYFQVLEVLDLSGVIIASSLIALMFIIPFAVDKDRNRIERRMWNKLSLISYLKYYPLKLKKFMMKLKKYVWIIWLFDLLVIMFYLGFVVWGNFFV